MQSYALAVIAMLSAVIAAFLYLRIMVSVWIADPEAGDDAREAVRVPWTAAVGIVLSVGFTLAIGVAPGWLIDLGGSVSQPRAVVANRPDRPTCDQAWRIRSSYNDCCQLSSPALSSGCHCTPTSHEPASDS